MTGEELVRAASLGHTEPPLRANPDPKGTNSQYVHAQGRALSAIWLSSIQMFYYLLLEIYTLALAYFASIVLWWKIEIQK